jgi:hypothetical protein
MASQLEYHIDKETNRTFTFFKHFKLIFEWNIYLNI